MFISVHLARDLPLVVPPSASCGSRHDMTNKSNSDGNISRAETTNGRRFSLAQLNRKRVASLLLDHISVRDDRPSPEQRQATAGLVPYPMVISKLLLKLNNNLVQPLGNNSPMDSL